MRRAQRGRGPPKGPAAFFNRSVLLPLAASSPGSQPDSSPLHLPHVSLSSPVYVRPPCTSTAAALTRKGAQIQMRGNVGFDIGTVLAELSRLQP